MPELLKQGSSIFPTALSSSVTAVNLPSWWSYKVAASSWEIPPVSLHLDPPSFKLPFKDTEKKSALECVNVGSRPGESAQQLLRGPLREMCV